MHSLLRKDLERAGVAIHEHAGIVRFDGPNEVGGERAPRLRARRFIVCVGGVPRRLEVDWLPHLTATHSDAWGLDGRSAVDGRGRCRRDRRTGGV